MKRSITAEIKENREIAKGIFKMTVLSKEAAEAALPGQFMNIYPESKDKILPRPISICDADKKEGTVTFVYRVAGGGTLEFSGRREGEQIRLGPPAGNGFDLKGVSGHALIAGGGIGVPPLVYLAKELKALGITVDAVIGFKEEPFLEEALKAAADRVFTVLETRDGMNAVEFIKNNGLAEGAGSCFSCGPEPMLFALADLMAEHGVDAQISVEERMGCGYGACVGCVKDILDKETGEVVRKKVCKDGPVFRGSEVVR